MAAVQETVETWGQLDILHNNVGISLFGGAVELSEADWDRSIDTNLKSVFLACKHALPIMERQSRGVITNISSILSVRVSWYDQVAYYASKAGVDHTDAPPCLYWSVPAGHESPPGSFGPAVV